MDNEAKAREAYCDAIKESHDSFGVRSTGLHVSPIYPYLGASSDGLVSCSCCSEGLLEIKCPYSIRNEDPTQVEKANFFLKTCDGGQKLSKSHNYYYQVQGQMICNYNYCDFVCWTPKGTHIERDDVFCRDMQERLEAFFVDIILPRILTGTYMLAIRKMSLHSLMPNFAIAVRGNLGRWWHVITLFVV